MKPRRFPLLVAIVGGSGAGKSQLAKQLQMALGRDVARVSLDDFYRDRSGVSPGHRARINFDHPRAIDWQSVHRALEDFSNGRATPLPRYDFQTHCRVPGTRFVRPKALLLMDGLWLLHRRLLRRRFGISLFIRCNARTRLRRRLIRDSRSRGRTRESVRDQFMNSVEPMHARFVAPQERWADVILNGDFTIHDVKRLARQLRARLHGRAPASGQSSKSIRRMLQRGRGGKGRIRASQ